MPSKNTRQALASTEKALLTEREKRQFGSAQRIEEQILLELRYSGYLEELAGLGRVERVRRFDARWSALTAAIRQAVIDASEDAESTTQRALRIIRGAGRGTEGA